MNKRIKNVVDAIKYVAVFLTFTAAILVLGLIGLALTWLFLPAIIALCVAFVVWAAFQD